MKNNTVEKDLRSLHEEVIACRKEIFNLRLNSLVGQVKDTSQYRKLRKQIARAKTAMTMKQK
ncbi:MAG: Ribosomal protein [Candidatus Dependentiae bacterium]|nr:Ribosomal protein [Candidatus Dependentiae bacterium]